MVYNSFTCRQEPAASRPKPEGPGKSPALTPDGWDEGALRSSARPFRSALHIGDHGVHGPASGATRATSSRRLVAAVVVAVADSALHQSAHRQHGQRCNDQSDDDGGRGHIQRQQHGLLPFLTDAPTQRSSRPRAARRHPCRRSSAWDGAAGTACRPARRAPRRSIR